MDAGPVVEAAVVGDGLRGSDSPTQCLQLRGREVGDVLAVAQRMRLRRRGRLGVLMRGGRFYRPLRIGRCESRLRERSKKWLLCTAAPGRSMITNGA